MAAGTLRCVVQDFAWVSLRSAYLDCFELRGRHYNKNNFSVEAVILRAIHQA